VRALVKGKKAEGLTICTIHSACVRLLRKEIDALGYGTNFSIYDEASQQSLARTVLRDLKGAGQTGSAGALLEGVVHVRETGDVMPSSSGERDGFLLDAVTRYREELKARNAIDFDDIIALTAELLETVPEAAARWRERWRYLLVDEYQDTNPLQEKVIAALAGPDCNLCVVGDDDQSVYGWRGAQVEFILGFPKRHPGARIVRLEQNYRSSGRIVAVANAVVQKNVKRHDKTIFTERGPGPAVRLMDLSEDTEEAEFVAGEIAGRIAEPGADPWKVAGEHAIVFRTNDQVRVLEQALRQAEVPYRLLGGRSFFDRKEVLDVLAYLRVALNPKDEEALFRIANTPSRGLGAKALAALRENAKQTDSTVWQVLEDVARGAAHPGGLFSSSGPPPSRERHELGAVLSNAAERGTGQLVGIVERLRKAALAQAPTLIDDFLSDCGYQQEVDRTYADAQVRLNRWNLAQEVQSAWTDWLQSSPEPTARDFVDGLALRSPEKEEDGSNATTLATVHASKGLEFDRVYVVGCEDGIMPHAKSVDDGPSLEEERRLFYVAITRARNELTLTRARIREVRGKEVETLPSRFLADLPEDFVETPDMNAPASEDSVATHLARLRALDKG
jgi:superfamily I DNA/RNA helicase